MTTNFSDDVLQLLNVPPAKCLNESISQKQREKLLPQVVSGFYDPSHSNVIDDDIQDENRDPHVRDPGAQTLVIKIELGYSMRLVSCSSARLYSAMYASAVIAVC